MAGKKGMRHYSEEQIESIKEMERKGMTHREIGKEAGLEMKQVRKLLERQRRREREIAQGAVPKRKGRPRKTPMTSQQRIQELEREVEFCTLLEGGDEVGEVCGD